MSSKGGQQKQQEQKEEGQRSQQQTPTSTPRSQAPSEARTPRSQAGTARSGSKQQNHTPRRSVARANKIYRTPPTPPPVEIMEKEKSFILDCNAVSSISTDYNRANPKLGPVIPPYNSQNDRHVGQYFHFLGVKRTLKKTGQDFPGTSIDGRILDRFHTEGHGWYYLAKRNQFGAGHSRDAVDGHAQFMQGIKPVVGYNGKYGYRRNNPWLRSLPSPFGTASTSPTH